MHDTSSFSAWASGSTPGLNCASTDQLTSANGSHTVTGCPKRALAREGPGSKGVRALVQYAFVHTHAPRSLHLALEIRQMTDPFTIYLHCFTIIRILPIKDLSRAAEPS